MLVIKDELNEYLKDLNCSVDQHNICEINNKFQIYEPCEEKIKYEKCKISYEKKL